MKKYYFEVPFLNFEADPGVPLLNFKGVWNPILNIEGDLHLGSQGLEVPDPGVLV